MADQFVELVDKGLSGVPQEMSLKLPKLKKAEAPKEKK